jgi:hypothetical protein
MVTHDARCTREIKAIIAMAKAAFHEMKTLFTGNLDLNLRKKLVKYYFWSMDVYGAETWTLWKVDQKYPERFEMWCFKSIEETNPTEFVENQEVLKKTRMKGHTTFYIKYNERSKNGWVTFA